MTAINTIVPTVNDWFSLTLQFPEYAKLSDTPLKDYGYMAIMSEIVKIRSVERLRVLEFGHMFNAELFVKIENHVEAWGIDDIGSEHYIPQGGEWETQYKTRLLDRCPTTHFVRGYLGRDLDTLPLNYFDIICSVSVYDNIPTELWPGVTRHAFAALRPGGVFINSYDYQLRYKEDMVRNFIEVQRSAGLTVADAPQEKGVDPFIESQFAVMTYYQQQQPPENREYMGNFGTVLTVASKSK